MTTFSIAASSNSIPAKLYTPDESKVREGAVQSNMSKAQNGREQVNEQKFVLLREWMQNYTVYVYLGTGNNGNIILQYCVSHNLSKWADVNIVR